MAAASIASCTRPFRPTLGSGDLINSRIAAPARESGDDENGPAAFFGGDRAADEHRSYAACRGLLPRAHAGAAGIMSPGAREGRRGDRRAPPPEPGDRLPHRRAPGPR